MKRYYLSDEKSKQVLHAWFPPRKKAANTNYFANEEDPCLYLLGVPLRYTKTTENTLDLAIKAADALQISYGMYKLQTYWAKRL